MASNNKKALGKGLGALLGENSVSNEKRDGILEVSIYDIDPNTEQPRKKFDDEKIKTLSESIKTYGIVQPIIVKQYNDRYKIIAGERRWRAARIAGLKSIPVIIKNISEKNVNEIALIENLQRQDLNSIEEAESYDKLIREHDLTQEQLAVIVGKSRSAITNCLRLLNLEDEIKEFVINGDISEGHARALIACSDKRRRRSLAERIIRENMSVREIEKIIKNIANENQKKVTHKKDDLLSDEYADLQEKIQNSLGTKVKLTHKGGKGSILVEYYSVEELEGILTKLGINYWNTEAQKRWLD